MRYLAPIVEGQGEVEAVPALIHRVAKVAACEDVRVNPPIRVRAGTFLNNEAYFRKYYQMAAIKAAYAGGCVLILLDCDMKGECPATIGPKLLARARATRDDVGVIVCLAFQEFESWFVAAVDSLVGWFGIPEGVVVPGEPESIRDAKGWLEERMNCSYDPLAHQLSLTRNFDLTAARRSKSFDRFYRKISGYLSPQ